MCRYGVDVWVCVSKEGRGWESLGTDVHLVDWAEGLTRSHLKTNLYCSLETVFCHFKHAYTCVCVCIF